MLRVGDRVCPFLSMHMKGTITEILMRPHKQMLVGGSLSHMTYVRVNHDKKIAGGFSIVEYPASELMKIDD